MIWLSFKKASLFFCFCWTMLYDFSVFSLPFILPFWSFVFFYIYCMFPCVALDLPAMYDDSTCMEAIFFLSFEHLLDTLTFIHIVMCPQKWIDFWLLSAAFSIYVDTTSEVQRSAASWSNCVLSSHQTTSTTWRVAPAYCLLPWPPIMLECHLVDKYKFTKNSC